VARVAYRFQAYPIDTDAGLRSGEGSFCVLCRDGCREPGPAILAPVLALPGSILTSARSACVKAGNSEHTRLDKPMLQRGYSKTSSLPEFVRRQLELQPVKAPTPKFYLLKEKWHGIQA
jgi:hypothetical protein